MRTALSDTLVDLAKNDKNIILLTGDHGYSLFDDFRKECSSQYINAGIAEQNMVGVASGLARMGFKPIVYGLSAFIPIRVLEQIKLDVAHDKLPVIFIGDGAGFVYSHLGTSHQSLEDIACTRSIPNLSVYSPADKFELIQCMKLAYKESTSVYLRIGKSDLGNVHKSLPIVEPGKLIKVITSNIGKYSFIATGSMVKTAIDIANNSYPEADVWSVPIIKPINFMEVGKICLNSEIVIVFEEHSKYGGLGSLIAEIASELSPVRVLRIAANDRFSQKCGTYEYLLYEYGLNNSKIKITIDDFLSRKL